MFNAEISEKIACGFPGLNSRIDGTAITYLDNAATTLKPQAMIDAVNEYYAGVSSNVHRGKNYSLEVVSNRYEQARYRVAELLSCSGNEVVFTRNTTEGVNIVAKGLGLTKKDRVIVFSDAHHSNYLPWLDVAQIDIVRSNRYGSIDLEHYFELLKLRPKVVAITHCSNVTGVYCPLKEMAEAAKNTDALVVVDAAQSAPHRRLNVKELGVDFLFFSAHKMAGPTGLGILYGEKSCLEALTPLNLGGGMVDWVEAERYQLRKIPHRFEAGTPNIAGAYGLAGALGYLNTVGFDALEAHDKYLGNLMLGLARERPYIQVINSDESADRGAVVSMKIAALPNLDELARVLSDSYGIMCRNGHLCAQPYVSEQASGHVLRISGYLYTTEKDIYRFFNSLDELSHLMFD